MMMMESAMAVGFRSCSGFSSSPMATCRPSWNFSSADDSVGLPLVCRRSFSHSSQRFPTRGMDQPADLAGLWNKIPRRMDGCSFKSGNNILSNRVRAAAPKCSGSTSDPMDCGGYHPSEEIGELLPQGSGDARLTDAEVARTVIEVNDRATLMLSGMFSDEIHENIFWPELSYVTDRHGDIYFKVRNTDDILQPLTAENNFVQVLIGLGDMPTEMELSGPADIDFDIEEITDEDSDTEDDFEEDWMAILEDEEDESDSSETLGDWATLDTMHSCRPMQFARKLAEVALDDHLDLIYQPSSGLSIQGLLRPAFIEECSIVRKNIAGYDVSKDGRYRGRKIVEDKDEGLSFSKHESGSQTSSKDGLIWSEELEKDDRVQTGYTFYKLEMMDVQLVSPYGNQMEVKVKDIRQARPDVIADSADKIISRLEVGGEKTVEALKSLCWRCKGIKVEEVALVAVDSLGFDLRVCSGTQVQTLRFTFKARATSEYSAERQLHGLVFPRIHQKPQTQQEGLEDC